MYKLKSIQWNKEHKLNKKLCCTSFIGFWFMYTNQFCFFNKTKVLTISYLFFFLWALSDSWPLSSSSLSSEALLLLLLDELLEDSLDESLATPVSSLTSIVSASAANSGSFSLSTFNHLRDNFGLPRTWCRAIIKLKFLSFSQYIFNPKTMSHTVLCHTTGKFVREEKFCVTAMVSSRLRTTCHQPPGTNTVSPGPCKISIGLQSWGHAGNLVRGYMTENQVIASSLCLPPSAPVTFKSSLGVLVGNRHHLLWPEMRAFHALVPKGSIWIPVPIAKI